MAKFKPCNADQLITLSISMKKQLVPGTLEYTINELVEKHIDLSVFEGRYKNDITGATAIVSTSSTTKPQALAQNRFVCLLARLVSSRQIE